MPAPQTEVLITVDGVEHARHVIEPGDYMIGRSEDCDLRVDADRVSQQHAKIILNYDHALIEDLGSSTGTFVNDQPVTERTRLWPNQKIRIGAATVTVRRLQGGEPTDMSLAPAQQTIRRMLPAEMLREKKYDIGAVVARGGMGAILDAREAAIERKVAMKVMRDTNDSDAVARFVAEAKVTGQLEHPNVVPVHELGVDENGQPFYTMKMVRGVTLKKVVELRRYVEIPNGEVSSSRSDWGWRMGTKSNDYEHVRQVKIGFGELPPHSTACVKVERLTALGESLAELQNPVVHVGNGQVVVHGKIPSGHFLQYDGSDSAMIFDENWQTNGKLLVERTNATMPHGTVNVSLTVAPQRPLPWLEMQFLTTGTPITIGISSDRKEERR